MLTLKKSSKNKEINVCFREKEKFFSQTLCKGLAIAFGFHLSAFLIFNIAPFKIVSSFIFPASNVQANFSAIQAQLMPLKENDKSYSELVPPFAKPSLPLLTDTDNLLIRNNIELPIKQNDYYFESISYNPVKVKVTGDLAMRPWHLKKEFSKFKPFLNIGNINYYIVTYAVQIQPENGEIFWFEKKNSNAFQELEQFTEQILLGIQFSPSNTFDHLIGEVEILVKLEDIKQLKDLQN